MERLLEAHRRVWAKCHHVWLILLVVYVLWDGVMGRTFWPSLIGSVGSIVVAHAIIVGVDYWGHSKA